MPNLRNSTRKIVGITSRRISPRGRDRFAAAAQRQAELAFQIGTHGLDDVGNNQRAGVEAEVDRRRARASFAS